MNSLFIAGVALLMSTSVLIDGVPDESARLELVAPQEEAKADVLFQWGFGALVGKDRAFVPITRDTTLASGDEMKMYVKLKKECYVYLLHENPRGEISLLFPYRIQQFGEDYEVEKNYYIPKGRGWFELDKNTGLETFFLLASSKRFLELEALIGDYEAASGSKKEDLRAQIIDEIRKVRRRYRTLTTAAERPITIGGNIRGTEEQKATRRPDVSTIGTEVSATTFYGKTFTIDHQ